MEVSLTFQDGFLHSFTEHIWVSTEVPALFKMLEIQRIGQHSILKELESRGERHEKTNRTSRVGGGRCWQEHSSVLGQGDGVSGAQGWQWLPLFTYGWWESITEEGTSELGLDAWWGCFQASKNGKSIPGRIVSMYKGTVLWEVCSGNIHSSLEIDHRMCR